MVSSRLLVMAALPLLLGLRKASPVPAPDPMYSGSHNTAAGQHAPQEYTELTPLLSSGTHGLQGGSSSSWLHRLTSDHETSTADSFVRIRSPSPQRFQYNPAYGHGATSQGGHHNAHDSPFYHDSNEQHEALLGSHNNNQETLFGVPISDHLSNPFSSSPFLGTSDSYSSNPFLSPLPSYQDYNDHPQHAGYYHGGYSSTTDPNHATLQPSYDDYQLGQLDQLSISGLLHNPSEMHVPLLSVDHYRDQHVDKLDQTRWSALGNTSAHSSLPSRAPPTTPRPTLAYDKWRATGRYGNENGVNIWIAYDMRLKRKLLEVIHLHTGLLKESIAKKCRAYFSDELKDALLSADEERVMWAVRIIYPPYDRHTMARVQEQTWANHMSLEDSIEVVRKMARYTDKDPEILRNFFLRLPLTEEQAHDILHDTNGDVCKWYMMEMGLDRKNEKMIKKGTTMVITKTIEVWPWMQNLDIDRKKEVIRRVQEASRHNRSTADCYKLLRQSQVEAETATQILQSDVREVRKIVQELEAGQRRERHRKGK
ncbi:hypothetical protein CBS101457_000138 [Exobasidium rhododendri]|nr:hypothetical protein CBS101457_000138 [Exobasidium rhododendri]